MFHVAHLLENARGWKGVDCVIEQPSSMLPFFSLNFDQNFDPQWLRSRGKCDRTVKRSAKGQRTCTASIVEKRETSRQQQRQYSAEISHKYTCKSQSYLTIRRRLHSESMKAELLVLILRAKGSFDSAVTSSLQRGDVRREQRNCIDEGRNPREDGRHCQVRTDRPKFP